MNSTEEFHMNILTFCVPVHKDKTLEKGWDIPEMM